MSPACRRIAHRTAATTVIILTARNAAATDVATSHWGHLPTGPHPLPPSVRGSLCLPFMVDPGHGTPSPAGCTVLLASAAPRRGESPSKTSFPSSPCTVGWGASLQFLRVLTVRCEPVLRSDSSCFSNFSVQLSKAITLVGWLPALQKIFPALFLVAVYEVVTIWVRLWDPQPLSTGSDDQHLSGLGNPL